MSKAQRVDDRSFWAGKGDNTSPFPKGNKTKTFMPVEGAGALKEYQDKNEDIQSVQKAGVGKMNANKPKTGYRN